MLAGCGGGGSSGSTSTGGGLSSCNINGKQQDLGASYVTSIEVAGVSCGQAEKVVVAYHHCRLRTAAPAAPARRPWRASTCTEGARQSVPGVQYNATADCRKGDAEIKSTYTQNF